MKTKTKTTVVDSGLDYYNINNKLIKYYLDTELVFKLDSDKIHLIFNLYSEINNSRSSGRPFEHTQSYFNTLLKGGYIKKMEENTEEKAELING